MLFSVIIATYNRARYIRATLDSLQAQEFTDYETIVVDDGSTDETMSILQKHPWIRVLRQNNKGPGAARNYGVSQASGEYIAFLDSDDIWFPWTLSTFAKAIEQYHNPALIAAKLKLFWNDQDLAVVKREPVCAEVFPDYYASSHKHYFVGSCMMVVQRELFYNTGGFTERRIYAEDADLAVRFGLVDRFVQILAPVTLGYRQHETNACKNWELLYQGELNLVQQERAGKYPGGDARRRDRLRLITLHTRPFSIACVEHGYPRHGWDLYWKTVCWHLQLVRWKYLCAFPLVAAWYTLRGQSRDDVSQTVEETS